MITLTGSSPLTLSFSDGSSHSYALTDPFLRSAVEFGDPSWTNAPDGEAFVTIDFPSDLKGDLNGVELDSTEVVARFSSFMIKAIRRAVEDFDGEGFKGIPEA